MVACARNLPIFLLCLFFHTPHIIFLSHFISRFCSVSATVFLGSGSMSSLSYLHPLFKCFILVILFFNISVVNLLSSMTPPPQAGPPTTVTEPQEIDLIYQVLKQAGEISSSRSGTTRSLTPAPPATAPSTTLHGSVSVKQPEQPNGTGSTAPNVGSFHRRSGPSQQQPLLLRGAASSLTVGPVPHSSISGVFVPSMFQCSWC
jgi:hypothetical protein